MPKTVNEQGPELTKLTRRLSECPPDFLDEPVIGTKGVVRVDAVAADLVLDLGAEFPEPGRLERFRTKDRKERNRLRLVLLSSWLLHDEWFVSQGRYGKRALAFLEHGLDSVAKLVDANLFVSDPDRREELSRLALDALDLIPAGESDNLAADRLETLSSVIRSQVVAATKAKEEAARKLREAMRQKAAQEAAAKYNRE